jgi:hypothetical protein
MAYKSFEKIAAVPVGCDQLVPHMIVSIPLYQPYHKPPNPSIFDDERSYLAQSTAANSPKVLRLTYVFSCLRCPRTFRSQLHNHIISSLRLLDPGPFIFHFIFLPYKPALLQPLDKVQPARRVDDAADLAGLQRKGGVLKLLLHVAAAKVAEVAPLARAAAVRLGLGQVAQARPAAPDRLLVALDDLAGVLF